MSVGFQEIEIDQKYIIYWRLIIYDDIIDNL